MSEKALRQKLGRARQRIEILENMITERSLELSVAHEEVLETSKYLQDLQKTLPIAVFVVDWAGKIELVNDATCALLGYAEKELVGLAAASIFHGGKALDLPSVLEAWNQDSVLRGEKVLSTKAGAPVPVLLSASMLYALDHPRGVVCTALDLREQKKLEVDLRQAQKLESVGRLAAGVAHEINTPVQFVSDSVHFVHDSMGDLSRLLDSYRSLRQAAEDGMPCKDAAEAAKEAEEEADLPYLLENIPKALERAIDGLGRVTSIVRSLKDFAHPDQKEMTAVDLNQAIKSTLTIARNEYKYVAELETDFGDLPRVTCHGGEVNQVILNIVVNAAHAISDIVKGTEQKGRIAVRTRRDGDYALISISDTGGGIPKEIRDRVFDPFFTTKEVGKGTGQGLAIARSVVVEKHRGQLSFESEVGKGTTFFVRLPLGGVEERPAEEAA